MLNLTFFRAFIYCSIFGGSHKNANNSKSLTVNDFFLMLTGTVQQELRGLSKLNIVSFDNNNSCLIYLDERIQFKKTMNTILANLSILDWNEHEHLMLEAIMARI